MDYFIEWISVSAVGDYLSRAERFLMEEFVVANFQWETVRLDPDGFTRVQGLAFPQSAGIKNLASGDVTVNKEPGEGNELRLQDPRGKIVASYSDGQWRIRKDIKDIRKALNAAPAPAAPAKEFINVTEDDSLPYPIPGSNVSQQSPYRSKKRVTDVIVNFVFITGIVVVCLFFFGDDISQFFRGYSAKREKAAAAAQTKLIESQRDDAYRKLESDVRQRHMEASKKLDELEGDAQSFAGQFEQAVGVSPERIATTPKDTPRAVDAALLSDGRFLRAWNQTLNAYPTRASLETNRRVLTEINERIGTRTLENTDQKRLDTLIVTARDATTLLQTQAPNLEIIRERIAQERLRERVESSERKKP